MGHSGTKDRTKPGQALVRLLAKRLQGGTDSPELPLVVKNQVGATGTVQLLVIWDAWRGLAGPDRGEIITEAYEAVGSSRSVRTIIPFGFSTSEALSLGYLPYRIVPVVRKSDKVSNGTVLDAMKSAGGVPVRVGDESQLRFATLEQAQEAYRALLAKAPGPFWTLIHEQSPAESA